MSKAQTKERSVKELPVTPQMLGVIVSPLITEKSTMGSQHNQVSFKVRLCATKPEIKSAIETLYKVKVKAVNTSILKGKTKIFKGRPGVRSDVKKAIVTLEPGHQIDVTAGV